MHARDLSESAQEQTPDRQLQAEATCRTCKNCRRKKVKCGGQHPKCKGCRLRNQDCEYPQDARRTAVRSRKSDIRTHQQQPRGLGEQVHEPINSHAPNEGSIFEADFGVIGDSHGLIAGSNEDRQMLSPPENGRYNSLHRGFQHHSLHGSQREAQQYPTTPGRIQEPGRVDKTAAPEPVPGPESTIQGREVQVYGATSLLHDHPSHTSTTNSQLQENVEDVLSKRAVQDRLVSHAAISRQHEITLYITPGITANIDFDGVPADLAMHLLDLHWNRLHLLYLLTYRPAIMDSLINNKPYVNKLLLNAIYLQSSLYSDRAPLRSDRQDSDTAGLRFYDRFKSLLSHYIDEPTMPTVVALLVCGACLLQYGQQSAGWVYSGMAHRMILDLGYHLDIPSSQDQDDFTVSSIQHEMRRRVYWGAYANDKFQSLFLGRPPAIHLQDCNISQEYLDSYEEMEEWRPYIDPKGPSLDRAPVYQGRPSYALSTFKSLLQLSSIAAEIIDSFYSIKSGKTPAETLIQTRDKVRRQLEDWKRSLPEHLWFEPGVDSTPPPHQITPHTTYWTLVILTEQAFLTGGFFNHVPSLDPQEGRSKCINAALNIWKLVEAYKDAFSLRHVHYGISYATYSAVLVMLQQSHEAQDQHFECIQFFWHALLDFERDCSHSLKRPLRLLKSLMRRVETVTQHVNVDELERVDDSNATAPQTGADETLRPDTVDFADLDTWGTPWYNSIADDTIFGMFMQD